VLTGLVLAAFAAFCFVAAVWRELFPGMPPLHPDVRRLPRVLLVALNSFSALVALAFLFGIWWAHQRDLTSPSSVISSRAVHSIISPLLITALPMAPV
jgi:hypothetical protein